MPVSTARVETDSPERYAKQLCEHLSRRSTLDYACLLYTSDAADE